MEGKEVRGRNRERKEKGREAKRERRIYEKRGEKEKGG